MASDTDHSPLPPHELHEHLFQVAVNLIVVLTLLLCLLVDESEGGLELLCGLVIRIIRILTDLVNIFLTCRFLNLDFFVLLLVITL